MATSKDLGFKLENEMMEENNKNIKPLKNRKSNECSLWSFRIIKQKI